MTATMTPRKSMEPYLYDAVEFYPHQVEGIRLLARMRNFLLADDMGLGKSLQALVVFLIDVIRGWCTTAIVVCPVTLKENWADEVEKFTRVPYIVLEGSPKERQETLLKFATMTGPRILICNYEQVKAHLDVLNAMKFDVAIFDEAHYLKNPQAARTEACQKLRSKRSFLLTGTPMLNHVNELWSLLHRIDPGAYPKYYSFVNRYCVFGGYKDKQIIGVKNEKELRERLNTVMVRRLKSEVLDLPEVQIIQRRVSLVPEAKKLYSEVVEDLRLTREGLSDPEAIENALTKALRLKQICGTTFTFTGKDESSKLDLAVEDAKEIIESGHRLVIFTQFRDVQACTANRLQAEKIKVWQLHGDVKQSLRQGVVNEWSNSKEPGVLICMLQVAGIGLNMTAARHGFFLDKLWVPGLNQQAIDRLHRIGQSTTQPVQIFEYICKNTIENRVESILRTKKSLFANIVETSAWKKKLLQALLDDD